MTVPTVLILLVLAVLGAVIIRLVSSRRELLAELSRMRAKTASQEAIIREESRSSAEEGNRLGAILESMTEGVVVVDPEQKILLVNSALARSFSFETKDAQGRYFWEMFRDPEINALMRQAVESRKAFRIEHEALLSHSIFDIQLSPVFIGSDLLGVAAVFRDITVFKEFDRLRSEFVANVSHELKTPLTSILGFVETLKEGAIDDRENRLKFLQVIEDQSKHLHVLIEDLLYLSRLEAAKDPLRLEPVDLAKLLEKIRMRFAPLLKENRLTLDVDLGPVASVVAEASSLERALSNLVDNAVKYNRPNGRVRLETAAQAGGTAIRVVDTGMGIPPNDMNRIFERFYRSDKSRSRELGGTGLGLSIVKHIAERHGGRVDVESVPGEGSVFTLFLPK